MTEQEFTVVGSTNRTDVFVQPRRNGRGPVLFKNERHVGTLLGLNRAGEVPEIMRTAHRSLIQLQESAGENPIPCIRSPDPLDPILITSANCLLCHHFKACKEETARRLGESGLTVKVDSQVTQEEIQIIQTAIKGHLPT